MTTSLSDFKAQYKDVDVFAPALRLKPEDLILKQFTFLPYVRSGIAATLKDPFDWSRPARTTIEVGVPVVADIGAAPSGVKLTVRGPGDVLRIDNAQVIRTYPKDGQVNAESEDLAHIEFDRPDLPWLFTPAGPDGKGHLVPWLSLVVVTKRIDSLALGPSGSLPVLSAPLGELQPLDEAWAWAHAQVAGALPKGSQDDVRSALAARLSSSNAAMNLSRLLCPRRLDPQKTYLACVVPTFEAGRQAGLGLKVTETKLAPAWKAGGDPEARILLPVYCSFSFSTAPFGNFETLARRLHGVPAPPGVGRRRMDASSPGNGIPPLRATDSGREQVVEAPLRSPAAPPVEVPPDNWPSEAHQQWPAATTDTLTEQLNASDEQLGSTAAPDMPTVGPPIYASKHIGVTRIDGKEPSWFHELNLDPRNRVVANLGTRVVQMDQEDLMASAWNQVAGIDAANHQIRLAQFARFAASSVYNRHFEPLAASLQLAMTGRVHKRVLAAPGETVFAKVNSSSLPPSVVTGAFRRLTRPRGPLARFAVRSLGSAQALYDRLVAVNDLVTRDYVRAYTQPDAVVAISPLSQSMVSDALLVKVFGGSAAAARKTLSLETAALAKPSATDVLARTKDLSLGGTSWFTGNLAQQVLPSLLSGLPTREQAAKDPSAAVVAAGRARLLKTFVEATAGQGKTWSIDPALSETLGFPKQSTVTTAEIAKLASALDEATRHREIGRELTVERGGAGQLDNALRSAPYVDGTVVSAALLAIGDKLVRPDGYTDIPRDQIRISELNLVPNLDPAKTVTARIVGRIGSLPAWLRPDWFLNLRVEPVMAAPSFPIPMCEALDRYDREWVIPGVGTMQPPELVTLLETSDRFVEAFLLGLNHEMARELLWRGYPTDQRGTYFRSFWTSGNDLIQPIHLFSNLPLGEHIGSQFHNSIVLLVRGELVRRYPGVLAHAVRQADVTNERIPIFEAGEGAEILFHLHLPPDILLVGFNLKPEDVEAPSAEVHEPNLPAFHQEYWFTLSENPTEPRFGLDDGPGNLAAHRADRNDLTWADFGIADDPAARDRDFLTTASPVVAVDGFAWGRDAAVVAHYLFQLPARAAFNGKRMLAQVGK